MGLLDRLVKKEDQTATVPLLADIPPYADNCKIVVCNNRGGNTVQTFGNAANKSGTNTASYLRVFLTTGWTLMLSGLNGNFELR